MARIKYINPPTKAEIITPQKPFTKVNIIFIAINIAKLEKRGSNKSKTSIFTISPRLIRQHIHIMPLKIIFDIEIAKILIDGILARIKRETILNTPAIIPNIKVCVKCPFA